MNRILKFFVPIALFCAPMLASAGPGYSLATTNVKPLDIPAFIAATDKMMASTNAQKYKGRLLLLQHIADGSDPATLSIVSIYKSAAELEEFTNLMQNDPARAEYMKTVVTIGSLQSTARLSTLKSWGDINDTDTIWNAHYFTVTDPAAFMAALNAWLNSPMGKKFPGQGHLAAMSIGGVEAVNVTHVISVGYASIAEMEAYGDAVRNDPDWAKFQAALRPASTHVGADLSRTLKQWGNASMQSLTTTP
jgi:hypothetical protein